MPLTDAQLEGFAAQAANMARRDLERRKDFHILISAYKADLVPPLFRMTKVEAFILERLGEKWLDDGGKKDVAFSVIRKAVDLMPPEAVIIVTVANGFQATERFKELPAAEQQKLLEAGYERCHKAVEEGLLTVGDVMLAVAQTPERVCVYTRDLDRRYQFTGKPDVVMEEQTNFGGRVKMFGVEDERQLGVAGRVAFNLTDMPK